MTDELENTEAPIAIEETPAEPQPEPQPKELTPEEQAKMKEAQAKAVQARQRLIDAITREYRIQTFINCINRNKDKALEISNTEAINLARLFKQYFNANIFDDIYTFMDETKVKIGGFQESDRKKLTVDLYNQL